MNNMLPYNQCIVEVDGLELHLKFGARNMRMLHKLYGKSIAQIFSELAHGSTHDNSTQEDRVVGIALDFGLIAAALVAGQCHLPDVSHRNPHVMMDNYYDIFDRCAEKAGKSLIEWLTPVSNTIITTLVESVHGGPIEREGEATEKKQPAGKPRAKPKKP